MSTSIFKSAPAFCSVYVISKGKVVSVRSAQRPAVNKNAVPRPAVNNNAVPRKQPSSRGLPPQVVSDHHAELEDIARYNLILCPVRMDTFPF